MKNLLVIPSLIAFSLLGCNNWNSYSQFKDQHIHMKEMNILTDTVYSIIKNFIEYTDISNSQDIVHQVFVDQTSDSIILYLSYKQYKEQVFQYKPTGYIKVGRNLVIFYSGLDYLLKENPDFLNRLHSELHKLYLKTKGQQPSLIEYPYWSVKLIKGKSTIKIDKRAFCPYDNIVRVDTVSVSNIRYWINKK